MTFELPREPRSAARARAALGGFRPNLDADDYRSAELIVSELVSNAIKYGGDGPVQLVVSSTPGRLRAEVVDQGSGFEHAPRDTADVDTPGGWGLHLTKALADDWGSYEGSTHVWFEIGSR